MFFKIETLVFVTQFICLKTSTFHRDNECTIEEKNETLRVEFYKKDDSLFILFLERVAWFEAASICKYYEADLCMPNSTSKANFVAYFLAESNFKFEDFWLGARRMKGQWMWMDGQLLLESNISTLWPWQDEVREGKDCLAIERRKHYTPMFAAISCYLLKPFICERAISARTNKPLPSLPAQSVRIHDSIFTFYHSRISWDEAVAFCRTIGQRLAVIPSMEYANILKTEMLRTRPNIENAWIGAYYYGSSWVWVSTGVIIPSKIQKDGYPPWFKGYGLKFSEGCVLLDRHFTSAFFLPDRCQRRRDFICEQYVHSPGPIHINNDTITCIYNSTVMYIYLIDKNWTEAQKLCHDKDTILAEPKDYETVKAIAVCLGDHPAEPKHVWLGGKHEKDHWLWANSYKEIGNSLPWCEDEFEKNSACLNLDRTDHDRPWVYGLQCKRKQPFVCVHDKIITTTEVISTTESCNCPCEQPPIPMYYKNNTFIAFMFGIEAEDSFNQCKYFGGIPFTTALSKDTKTYVLSYIRLAIEQCGCCTDEMVDFWVNDEHNKTCIALNLGSNKVVETIDCNTEKPFICQTFCSDAPNIEANENATIDCQWSQAAGKFPYKSCKFSCGSDYTIFGPDRFTCDYYGWKIHITEEEDVSYFRFPECFKTQSTAGELVNVLNEIEPEGIYFAVKESQKADRSSWRATLQFIMSIIQVFPISKESPLGLLTFSNTVNIRIPYNAVSSCKVLEILKDMEVTLGAEQTRYDLALKEVTDEIQKYQPNKKTLIFFLVDKENIGDDYDEFTQHIHKNNKIFVVGITGEKFIFDLDMVASLGRTLRLYTIKVRDYNALTNISLELVEYRSLKINCPKNLYILPDLNLQVEDSKQSPKRHIDFVQQDVTYLIIKNFEPYQEAKNQCKTKYGGNLIEDFRARKLLGQANLKKFYIEHFWTEQPGHCIAADVYKKEFELSDCNNKHPFVCVVDCSYLPPINPEDNMDNIEGQPHVFDCYRKDEILWGPPELHCNPLTGGWITNGHRISPLAKCLSNSDFVKKTLETLSQKRNTNKAGILFVLDESKAVFQEDLQIQLKFVETIVKLYPASKNLPYGLITFSGDANLRIPLQEEDSCKFVKNLTSVKLNTSGDTTNYEKAILMVDKQIAEYRQEHLTVVYFITNGLFIGDVMHVKHAVANLLRWDVEIYVFKIGQFDSEVTPEISTRDSKYVFNLFNINNYPTFGTLTDKLLKAANWPPLICQ